MSSMVESGISIVLRCRESEFIDPTISSVLVSAGTNIPFELVVVSKGIPHGRLLDIQSVKVFVSDARRIEAKKIGVEESSFERILFLDSDQLVPKDLMSKIIDRTESMLIIPERTKKNNFVGRVLDSTRKANETSMQKNVSISTPVIPRYFDKILLKQAFKSMNDLVIRNVTETEDSLIFYECLRISKSLGWVESVIYNDDPDLLTFVRKSYTYGRRNEGSVISGVLPNDYVKVIRQIQRRKLLNLGWLSPSIAISNILRGVPYAIGTVVSHLKQGDGNR